MRQVAWRTVVLWLLASGVAHAQREKELSIHVGIVPERGGHPLVMALGDDLQLVAHQYRCHYDVCEIDAIPERAQWTASAAAISISGTGLVRARTPGVHTVRVRLGDRSGQDSVRVLPPVKDLAWTSRPRQLHVGDTLRIAILARDSTGNVVRQLTLSEHSRGTGRSGDVLSYDDNGFTVLYIDQPGVVELVGRLAHRTDTLRIEAVARPR